MTPQELDQLRQQLEELKATYLETLSTSIESAKGDELDQARVGRLSRMDAIQSQAIVRSANRRIQEDLKSVQFSLERIKRGTYGWCGSCGRDIPFVRLRAIPYALKCIDCANRDG
jgi:DnaK suppressor protein